MVLHHGVVSCDDGSTKDLLIVETKTTLHFLDEDHLHSFPGIGTNQCSENSKANAIKPYSTSNSSNI